MVVSPPPASGLYFSIPVVASFCARVGLTLAELKFHLEKRYPGQTVVGFSISLQAISVGVPDSNPKHRAEQSNAVFNPFNGDVLDTAADRNNFLGHIHDFHLRLMMGEFGGTVMSWAVGLAVGWSQLGA